MAQIRHDIDHLAHLFETGQKRAFCESMEHVMPSRTQRLRATYLGADTFPILSMNIGTLQGISRAKELYGAPTEEAFRPRIRMEVTLRITVRGSTAHDLDELAFITSAIELLEMLTSETSIFRLVGIVVDMSTLQLGSIEMVQAATRLLELAVKDERRLIQVFILVPEVNTDHPNYLTPWIKLFQTLCRLESDPRHAAPSVDNKIKILLNSIDGARIVSGLLSALMFSHCYTTFELHCLFVHAHTDPLSVMFKYLGVLLSTRNHNIERFVLMQECFSPSHVDAMKCTIGCTLHELSEILWHHPWSFENRTDAFQTAELNSNIAHRFGWVMRDTGLGEMIDVFIPGLGHGVVNRHEWSAMVGASNRTSIPEEQLVKAQQICTVDWDLYFTTGEIEEQEAALLSFFRSLPWRDVESLRITELTGTPLPFGLFQSILKTFSSLKTLCIVGLDFFTQNSHIDVAGIVGTALQDIQLLFENETKRVRIDTDPTVAFLVSVLPHIGQNLKTLMIHQRGQSMQIGSLVEIIAKSSPLMEKLCLRSCGISSLGPLVSGYKTDSIRIKTLGLQHCSISIDEISRFVKFLGDCADPTSQVLQSLEIHVPEISCLTSFLDMLKVNRVLARLKVTYYSWMADNIVNFEKEFENFSGESVSVPRCPLPRHCIAAFISSLEANKLPWDRDMVHLVAQLAADRETRVVQLSPY